MAARMPKFVRYGGTYLAIKTIQYICTGPEYLLIRYTNKNAIDMITQADADELKLALKDHPDFICRSRVIIAKSGVKSITKQGDHVLIAFLGGDVSKLSPGSGVTVDAYFAKLMEELNA
jgi:hypothetical protein